MWSSFPPIRSNSSRSSPFSSTFHYVIIRRSRVPINLHPTRSCVRFPFLPLPSFHVPSAPFFPFEPPRLISHSLPSFSSPTLSFSFQLCLARAISLLILSSLCHRSVHVFTSIHTVGNVHFSSTIVSIPFIPLTLSSPFLVRATWLTRQNKRHCCMSGVMVGWLGVGWACGCFGGFDIWRCIGACMGGGGGASMGTWRGW